jgi:hypothetical protein
MKFRGTAQVRRTGTIMTRVQKLVWGAVVAILLVSGAVAEEDGSVEGKAAATDRRAGAATESALEPGFGAAVERSLVASGPGTCNQPELTAAPSRPNWTGGAATTQCGNLETDYGWLWQGMGDGVRQTMLPLSVRYGLTPRMDVRWGLPAHIGQSGGGTPALQGVSDQWVSTTYRFKEQGQRVPAMALSYGFKIPTANPAKGFGTGYADHQLVFIASRDLGKAHLDFNTVGTLAGGPGGSDGAVQYGLALSQAATKRLTWILETDGGPQPGTVDRFGQTLGGVQCSLRPWLVVDAAYARAWTAGSPRQQFTVGWTWSSRPPLIVLIRSLLTRWAARP